MQQLKDARNIQLLVNLTHASDVDILILHTPRYRSLLNFDATMDANRRARRLMSKIIMKMPVIPRSLFSESLLNGRDNIDEERPGRIFKDSLQGSPVALKVYTKVVITILCSSISRWHLSISFHAEYL